MGFDPTILDRSVVKKVDDALPQRIGSDEARVNAEKLKQFELKVRQQDKQLLIKAMTQAMAEEFPGPVGVHELLKDVAKVQSGRPTRYLDHPSGMKWSIPQDREHSDPYSHHGWHEHGRLQVNHDKRQQH